MSINETDTLPVLNKILAGHWMLQSAADIYENFRLLNRVATADCAGLIPLASVTCGVISMNTDSAIGALQLAENQLECFMRYSCSVPYQANIADYNVIPSRNMVSQVAQLGRPSSIINEQLATIQNPITYSCGLYISESSGANVSLDCAYTSVGVMTFRPSGCSTVNTGESVHQIAFTTDGMTYRQSADSCTWDGWATINTCPVSTFEITSATCCSNAGQSANTSFTLPLTYDGDNPETLELSVCGLKWYRGINYVTCQNVAGVCNVIYLLCALPANIRYHEEIRAYKNSVPKPGYSGFNILTTTCTAVATLTCCALFTLPGSFVYDASVPGSLFISVDGMVWRRGEHYSLCATNSPVTGTSNVITLLCTFTSGSKMYIETRNGFNGLQVGSGPNLVYSTSPSASDCNLSASFRQLVASDIPFINTNVDKIDGVHACTIPTANTIPVSGTDGKISTNWLNISCSAGTGLIPIAGVTGKLDCGWIPFNINVDKLDNAHACATATANTIPIADSTGTISSEWVKDLDSLPLFRGTTRMSTYIGPTTNTSTRVTMAMGASFYYPLNILPNPALTNPTATAIIPFLGNYDSNVAGVGMDRVFFKRHYSKISFINPFNGSFTLAAGTYSMELIYDWYVAGNDSSAEAGKKNCYFSLIPVSEFYASSTNINYMGKEVKTLSSSLIWTSTPIEAVNNNSGSPPVVITDRLSGTFTLSATTTMVLGFTHWASNPNSSNQTGDGYKILQPKITELFISSSENIFDINGVMI